MNYFAHGMRFVHRPYFLAGTAVPDWLNVTDRGVRLRPDAVEPLLNSEPGPQAELAAGILQHFEDDRVFHESAAFVETSRQLANLFRDVLGPDTGFRPGFLGHIVTELVLDAVLIEARPELLDDYYATLDQVDAAVVEAEVNRMTAGRPVRLAGFIPLFRAEEFLRDYADPPRLLYRLNQIMTRVRLNRLPVETTDVLVTAREVVQRRACELAGW